MKENDVDLFEAHLFKFVGDNDVLGFWIGEETSIIGYGASYLQGVPMPTRIGFLSKDFWPFKKATQQIGIIEVNPDLTMRYSSPTMVNVEGWLTVKVSKTYEGVRSSGVDPERFNLGNRD